MKVNLHANRKSKFFLNYR